MSDEILREIRQVKEAQVQMLGDIREIKTVVIGVPDTGSKGLVGEIACQKERLNKLYNRLWLVIVALAGSGAIGAGTMASILKVITGD